MLLTSTCEERNIWRYSDKIVHTICEKKSQKNVAYFCPTVSLEPWANNL